MTSKKIAIIGLGLIGGSIAKTLKAADNTIFISAFDKPEVLNSAESLKIIDRKLLSLTDIDDEDIVFLCMPNDLSLKAMKQVAPVLKEGSILTDVCGVKGVFDDEWRSLLSKGVYIGGHPMTGKEKGGFENSDPLLFENSVYIVSDKAKNLPQINFFFEVIGKLGARIRYLDPHVHDNVIASVSHLPQLVAVALVNAISNENGEVNYLDFAAGGFRDMTRIASSEFDIWESTLNLNKEAIKSSLKDIIKILKTIEESVDKSDNGKLKELFEKARRKRDEIPRNTKGFLNPLYDIFVYVKDEPGVLSRLTSVLYNNSINIKDMELLKIREGTGGTFRLSFETEAKANNAKILIEESGFATK